jgi:hypothetical protein
LRRTSDEVSRATTVVQVEAWIAEPQAVWRYPVAAGVVVEVQAGLPPWTLRRVKRAMAEMAALLQSDIEPEE